ncbi:MAG: ostA-like family protein [Alphaproteobacteria bacterium]|nr:ostA-like family protein [Alphaproteobacteria bacterium]
MVARKFLTVAAAMLVLAPGTDSLAQDSAERIEITADKALEWRRNDRTFIATGQALAKQGETAISADTLTADYRDGPDGNFNIWRMTAEGSVRISNPESTATGARAVYDVDNGIALMTGGDLRLVSPGQIVTARDRFEYHVTNGRLLAIGNALVVRGEDTLKADTVSVKFTDKDGKRTLESVEASGNVRIITPTETLHGDRGIYRAADNIAEIEGNVRIERGQNVLQGSRGQVNLTTNVSRLLGGATAGDGGRVRGVFYPGSTGGTSDP